MSADELTPEMVALAELMLRDLPPNEVLTTSAIQPLINCLFVEYDRLKRVEKVAVALFKNMHHTAYVAHGVDPVSRAIVPGSCAKCDLADALNGEQT